MPQCQEGTRLISTIATRLIYTLVLACAPFGLSRAEAPKDFSAIYAAKIHGFEVKATRELKTLANGTQKLSFKATSWLANIEESSEFDWSEQAQLVPSSYQYHRTGLGKDRHADLSFDWQNKIVTNDVQNNPWEMSIPDRVLDKLSYQVQLRSDLINQRPVLSYQVADGGRLKTYHFEIMGEEVLNTPLGQFHTVKVKRTRSTRKKRETYLWLAKDWDYLLVRLQQIEKGGKRYEINLAQAELAGETVKGF